MSSNQPWRVFVISARRPMNVIAMQNHFPEDEPVTWVVPADDAESYRATGARDIIAVDDPPRGSDTYALPKARNAALQAAAAAGEICIQSDDDLRRLSLWARKPGSHDKLRGAQRIDTDWVTVRDMLIMQLEGGSARLAGVAPTANVGFGSDTISTRAFVIGSLCATNTDEVLFDERLPLKEDYDFTCAHIERFGAVARINRIITDYAHYTNRGGAVSYRNTDNEHATAQMLLRRWPQYLQPHRSRPNELSFIRGTR